MTLMLHAGGVPVSYDELRAVPIPDATETHMPLPHHELVSLVRYTLGFYGHEITEEHHAIANDGLRYFGLMSLHSPYGEYTDTVGLRNSNDRTFPIGIAFGSRVFVCDNLSFMGEHVIRRKHTVKAKKELPGLVTEIVAPLLAQRVAQNEKLVAYQKSALTDDQAYASIVRMHKQDVIGVQAIGHVLKAYEEPPHDWGDRTCWRLFNAATFALAGRVAEKPDLTKELHNVIDGVCTVH